MQISNIIAGALLLLFGRRLFWLFLGVAGFFFGTHITPMLFGHLPHWLQLATAVAVGFCSALVAIFAQRVAFAFAGFAGGLYLAFLIVGSLSLSDVGAVPFIAFGAGILGAVIATLIMDSAIIILSCLIGAAAIIGELHLGHYMNIVIFVILVGTGFVIQEIVLAETKEE